MHKNNGQNWLKAKLNLSQNRLCGWTWLSTMICSVRQLWSDHPWGYFSLDLLLLPLFVHIWVKLFAGGLPGVLLKRLILSLHQISLLKYLALKCSHLEMIKVVLYFTVLKQTHVQISKNRSSMNTKKPLKIINFYDLG